MNEVVLGGNGFRDCATIIDFGGEPLLGVVPKTGEIELRVPAPPPGVAGSRLVIQGNRASGSDELLLRQLLLRSHEDEVRVYFHHALLLVVSKLSETSTHVHLDLRPLGVRVFSDSEGLHVGPHNFFNLAFQAESPAISVATDGRVQR